MILEQRLNDGKILRRGFLRGAVAGATALIGTLYLPKAYAQDQEINPNSRPGGLPPRGAGYNSFEEKEKYEFKDFVEAYRLNGTPWTTVLEKARIKTIAKWNDYDDKLRKKICESYYNPEKAAKKYLGNKAAEFNEFKEAYKSLSQKMRLLRRFKGKSEEETEISLFKSGVSIASIKKEYSELYPWVNIYEPNEGDLLLLYIQEQGKNRIDYKGIIERNKRTPMPKIRIVD